MHLDLVFSNIMAGVTKAGPTIQEAFRYYDPDRLPVKLLSSAYDFYFPFFVTPESLTEVESLCRNAYPDDVWIVSYPKAGTTWTQQIVKLIRNNGENDSILLDQSVPWPTANSGLIRPKVDISALPRPRAFKSHLPYIWVANNPSSQPCKFIYVSRNPKDTAVSYYYHESRFKVKHDDSVQLPWDEFFRLFMSNSLEFGNFFDHVLSWWAHKDDENVLFIKYEDMKKDLPGAVAKIAKFIGADISEEVQAKVVAQTTFDAMKKDDTANKSQTNAITKPGSTDFIRKGQVGDWRHLFTAEQSAEVDKMCQEKLAGTGLEFQFD